MLCPCPQLTAYWTPPPNGLRKICCCEKASKLPGQFGPDIQNPEIKPSKRICIVLGILLLVYFSIMDVFLYMRFAKTDILKDSGPSQPNETYSPFTHLSIKAMMNDHTSQYIVTPSCEYFDYYTGFSKVFSFITPNMISFFHCFLGFISGKWAASENLQDRRIGIVIFQVRTWLDSFDGVVYRSRSNTRLEFRTVRDHAGYHVDIWCDAIGGFCFCFGIIFYLYKRFGPSSKELPVVIKGQKDIGNSAVREIHGKFFFFWKVWCYGGCILFSGKMWDQLLGEFESVLQVEMKDAATKATQFELTHSTLTLVIFYMWRLLEGQALLQYFLIPIWLDKVWEFLNCIKYTLFGIILGLYLVSLLYVRHLRSTLGM